MSGLVILGAGGLAREVAEYVAALPSGPQVVGFVDPSVGDDEPEHAGIPVRGSLQAFEDAAPEWAIAGAGNIAPRRSQILEIETAGLSTFLVVHPTAVVLPSASLGDGSIVAPTAVVSANAVLGEHALVNYGATVGHDVRVGDCVVIGPGCHVSGWVTLEQDVYLGAGAVILPKVTIGRGAVVGAGAVVTRDVPPGVTVTGVPAGLHRP
jgi:sugar O-acyltransferase (sialic acid O-acetyltransferase NeuD family)